jgi:hypothetical protein
LGDDEELPPIESYARHFAACRNERFVLEASPQYFKGGPRSIELIREHLGRPRVIVMLRDPIARLWSEYRFRKSRLTIPDTLTFDSYVDECERVQASGEPRTADNQAYYWLAGGSYADHIGPWLDAFGDDLAVWFFEDMAQNTPSFMRMAFQWLGIDDAPATSLNYSVENQTVEVRNRTLQRLALFVNREEGPLRNRRSLKAPFRRMYYALNRQPHQERMPAETRDRLAWIFSESNAALATELRSRGRGDDLPVWLASHDSDP